MPPVKARQVTEEARICLCFKVTDEADPPRILPPAFLPLLPSLTAEYHGRRSSHGAEERGVDRIPGHLIVGEELTG